MSADLHVHIVEPEKLERDVRLFLKSDGNSYSDKVTKHIECFVRVKGEEQLIKIWDYEGEPENIIEHIDVELDSFDEDAVERTPNVWIGSVSWLKADLFSDSDTYIPQTVNKISCLIGRDLPVITEEFIQEVRKAFELPNNTIKEDGVWDGEGYRLANVDEVEKFLRLHMGKKVFQISW